MAYFLLSTLLLTTILTTLLYLTRTHWLPLLPPSISDFLTSLQLPSPTYVYDRLPSSFSGDMEAGLSSSNFDLAANNLAEGDSRAGLDDDAKREVLGIMRGSWRRMTFDEARRVYMERKLKANGIGADGRPRDPKFVSFS